MLTPIKTHLLLATLVTLVSAVILCTVAAASSDPTRSGYSFFGLGLNYIDYEENTARQIDGQTVDIETNTSVNIAQQSGTYVSFSQDWGFYLASASTLGESKSRENWELNEVVVRSNRVSFEQQRIAFLFSRRFSTNKFWLFGAQYGNTEFRRFATSLTPEADNFGLSGTLFDTGTESETVVELSAVAGYEKNTVFTTDSPGWRYQIQAVIGVPLITSISNTEISDGNLFSQSFNGLLARLNLTSGYQFSKNLFAAVALELSVSQRNAIDREISDSLGLAEFSENSLVYIYPNLSIYWSF